MAAPDRSSPAAGVDGAGSPDLAPAELAVATPATRVDGVAVDPGVVLELESAGGLEAAWELVENVSAPATTLSLGQVAQAFEISTTTARRWADEGRMRTTRTAGGHRRFAASEVRRLLAERGRAAISPVDPPRCPLPALAELAQSHGAALAQMSWRGMYGELRSGFFVDPVGVEAAGRWIGALSSGAATANYELVHEATSALMRAAASSGASLLERHVALERFAQTAARALMRLPAARAEIVQTRQLFAFLAQRQLAGAG